MKKERTVTVFVAVMLVLSIVCTMIIPAFAAGNSSAGRIRLTYGKSVQLETTGDNVKYYTTSKRVACVSSTGVVKSMGRGTCIISAVDGDTGRITNTSVTVRVTLWKVISNLIYFIKNLNCETCRTCGSYGDETTTTEPVTQPSTEVTSETGTAPVTEPSGETTDTTATTETTTELPTSPGERIYIIPSTESGAKATTGDASVSSDVIISAGDLDAYAVVLPVKSISQISSFVFDGKTYAFSDLEKEDGPVCVYNIEDSGYEILFIDYSNLGINTVILAAYYNDAGELDEHNVTKIVYVPSEPDTEPSTEESTATTATTTEATTEATTETTTESTTESTTEATTEPVTETTTEGTTAATTEPTAPAQVESAEFVSATSTGGTSTETITGADARNGNIFACGYSSSRTAFSVATKNKAPFGFVRMYDTDGNMKWQSVLAETSYCMYVTDVCALKNGNAAVCGYEYYENPKNGTVTCNPFTAEYDTEGNQLWINVLTGSAADYYYCIAATSDGFVVGGMAGSSDGDFSTIEKYADDEKTYSVGSAIYTRYKITADEETGSHSAEIYWNRYLSGDYNAQVSDISADSGNNVYLTIFTISTKGNFESFDGLMTGSTDNIIMKLNYAGTMQWYYTIATRGDDKFDTVTADTKGGCIVGGSVSYAGASFGNDIGGTLSGITYMGGVDAFLIKLDSTGARSWYRNLSGTGDEYVTDIVKTSSGYAVSGYTDSSNREYNVNYGGYDGFLDIVSSAGKQLDIYNLGGSEADGATALALYGDCLMVFGVSQSQDEFFDGMNGSADADMGYYDIFSAKYKLNV